MAPPASAQEFQSSSPWYLEAGAGLSFADDAPGAFDGEVNYDDGFSLHGALGRRLFDFRDDGRLGLSAELEYFYNEVDIVGTDFSAVQVSDATGLTTGSVLVNAVLDWDMSETVTFHLGLGAGLATSIDIDSAGNASESFKNEDDTAFAMQVRAGFSYQLGDYENFRFVAGYRWFRTEDIGLVETGDPLGGPETFDLEYQVHSLEVGMRWKAF
ncbi:MAG: outer membrane beta-barrel protein [Planctomycetota bacterium]